MPHATFTRPNLTTFTRLDELGLEVVGQQIEPKRAVLACRVVEPDQWCRRCGCEGTPRGTVVRRLAHSDGLAAIRYGSIGVLRDAHRFAARQ